MKRLISLLMWSALFAALVLGSTMSASADEPEPGWLDLEPLILESVADGMSPPISSLLAPSAPASALSALAPEIRFAEVPMFVRDVGEFGLAAASGSAPSALGVASTQNFNGPFSADLLQVFDGADNDDNALATGFFFAPPDTDGDVGPNHYVQMINVVTTIYDKNGNPLLGPFPNNVFWTGLGGLCETTNRGDPIVLYDEATDSWLLSQFAFDDDFTEFSLCVALSTTGDPTGSYYQHEFDFTEIGFPDYPKYGFVSDAIGVMVNLFTPPEFGFGGTGLGAINKAEALTAGPATMVFFNLGPSEFGFVAGDNDGPNFDHMWPTFATNNGGTGSTIDIWEINTPTWRKPEKSRIREAASIPVSPIDGELCSAFRGQCIDQPGSEYTGAFGTFPIDGIPYLEAISDRLMHRLQLRDFAGFADNDSDGNKRAVVTHTVDVDGNGKAGIRWYEFRDDGDGWYLYQEDTFSPDGEHRWMGSIAMNTAGDICVGYSISSQQTSTSIGAACQTNEASGSGVLDVAELLITDGQNVQRGIARWGDYSAMAIDPLDDTFWYTQEYARPSQFIGEIFGWATHIAEIQIPD